MKRREFVAAGLVFTAHEASADGWLSFRPEEAALVEALTDRIIPADEDPGAKAAGVVHYIDRQLAGPLKRFAASYRKGLKALSKSCQRWKDRDFLELSDNEKDEVLRTMERGEMRGGEWTELSAAAFFQMLVDHTMQGFYGSPKHGGNRGEASWKMLGIQEVMREDHAHGGGQ
jgi:gluconate 2-dehydrogenase gamma chain